MRYADLLYSTPHEDWESISSRNFEAFSAALEVPSERLYTPYIHRTSILGIIDPLVQKAFPLQQFLITDSVDHLLCTYALSGIRKHEITNSNRDNIGSICYEFARSGLVLECSEKIPDTVLHKLFYIDWTVSKLSRKYVEAICDCEGLIPISAKYVNYK